jgi:predicted PurR-regulated permease PerM
VVLVLATALFVGFLLYQGREALSPFIVGLLIVYLLDPPVERLARLRVPRWLAVLLVYVIAGLIVLEVLNLTLRPLVDQVRTFLQDLPGLAGQLDQQLRRLSELYRGLELPLPIREALDRWLADLAEGGVGFDPAVLVPFVSLTATLLGAIVAYLIIPVWVFYLLKDRPVLTAAFDRSLPPEWRPDIHEMVRLVERVFAQWVRGQLLLGLAVAISTFVGLLVLSATVDPIFGRFAVLLAITAGLLELLPIIGPIIAAVPAVLLAATAGPQAILAALLLYLLIQQVENNLLVPKIQGDAVELHPSAVMFALVVGGAVGGLLGAILALPITAAGRDVYRYLFRRLSPPSEAVALLEPPAAAVEVPAAPAR